MGWWEHVIQQHTAQVPIRSGTSGIDTYCVPAVPEFSAQPLEQVPFYTHSIDERTRAGNKGDTRQDVQLGSSHGLELNLQPHLGVSRSGPYAETKGWVRVEASLRAGPYPLFPHGSRAGFKS